jgi:hypothetical protein
LREKLSRAASGIRAHALIRSLCIVVALLCATTAHAQTATAPAQTRPRTSAPPSSPTNPQTRTQPPATPEPPADANAQTPANAAPSEKASSVSPDEADIAITANVTARELRFEKVPNPTVVFTGQPQRETVWEADRQNLPRPVRPGETYRDIGIRLRIISVFADIDRIVAEALGELPASDEAKPTTTSSPMTPKPTETQPTTSNTSAPAANPPTGKGTRP